MATGFMALATHQAQALEAYDVLVFTKGPVTLRPQLDVSETFNDNILYAETNLRSDFITTVSPGLEFQLGRKEQNYLEFDYDFDQIWYWDNSQLDAHQHRFAINNKLEGNKLRLTGSDRIDLLSSVLGGGISSVGQGIKVDRTTYSDVYTLNYAYSEKSSVYVMGNHSTIDYDPLPFQLYDVNNLSGTIGFSYQPLAKTSFFGEGFYGQSGVDPNIPGPKPPHSEYFGGFVGARGNFTERLSGMAKVGYEVREFATGVGGSSSPAFDISLSYVFSERTSASLGYSRRNYVSVEFANYSYVLDAVNLNVSHLMGADLRWRGSFGVNYGQYSYDASVGLTERSDSLLNAYVGLGYDIRRWLKANLNYSFELYESDAFYAIDYNVNRVTLGLAVGY